MTFPEQRVLDKSQHTAASERNESGSESDDSTTSVETAIYVGPPKRQTPIGLGITLPQDLVEPYPEPVHSLSHISRGILQSPPTSPVGNQEHVQLSRSSTTELSPTAPRSGVSSRQFAMAAPNGMNGGGAAPYPMGGLVQPGSHMEVQHIWTLVEELSSILQLNRDRYEELQEGIARAQVHNHEDE